MGLSLSGGRTLFWFDFQFHKGEGLTLEAMGERLTYPDLEVHPCNMKEFKLFVGDSEDNMTEVLHSALKNDSIPETFSVKHVNNNGICFPARYVKIVPLS